MPNALKKINLQLFAEGEPAAPSPAPAAEPSTITEPTPVPAPAEPVLSTGQMLKDMWERDNTTEPAKDVPIEQAPAAPDNPAPAQPEKIMNKYDSVGDLVKAYQSLQTTWNKDHMTLAETTKIVEQLKNEKAELEARLNQPPQPPPQPTPQPVDEFAGLDAEGILEKFYADPVGVLSKMAEKIVDSKVKPLEGKLNPIVEHTEAQRNLEKWNGAVTSFAETNSDMSEFLDGMKQYIAENNLQDSKEPEKVLKTAYYYAKGLKYAPPTDPATLLNDENFVRQIIANPTIKDAVVKEHMTAVRGTQNQIPNTIAGNSSNGAPAMPPLSLKGKPMSEVHKAASAFLFGSR